MAKTNTKTNTKTKSKSSGPVKVTRNVTPDKLDLRDRLYLPSITTCPAAHLSPKIKLPVLNQKDTNACTGFALSNVVNHLLIKAKRAAEAPVSPFMLYSMARRYDEFPGSKQDMGSSLRGAMKGWYKQGSCAQGMWLQEPMPKSSKKAAEDWWLDAVRRPLGAYYRVDTRSIADMHAALNEVGILYASALCHRGWDKGFNLSAARKATWEIPFQKAAGDDGGHAFVIVGYDESGFLIQNSWSEGWGSKGLAVLAYEDWLENAMDCWVAQLGVVTDQHLAMSVSSSVRTVGGSVRLAADPALRKRELAPFIIDMENNGKLSASGDFRTNEDDIEALVNLHITNARKAWKIGDNDVMDVAIYAHGGLTGESDAAETAAKWLPTLYDAHIFPIFLMWETDLWSTLKNRLFDLVSGVPHPTGGLRDQIQRFWNERLEKVLAPAGTALWGEMKQNAEAITGSDTSGGILLFKHYQKSTAIKQNKLRLHLIGHSAGAIVHSHLIERLAKLGWTFETVTFMAPAVTVERFQRSVLPAIQNGQIKRYYQFHLTDEAEQKDSSCRPILLYGRSLLYLVSESFEGGKRTPVLGMEKYFNEFIAPLNLKNVKAWPAPGEMCIATEHGAFDNDKLTMRNIVAELIKG